MCRARATGAVAKNRERKEVIPLKKGNRRGNESVATHHDLIDSGSDQANILIILYFHQNKPCFHGLNPSFNPLR